MEWVGAIKCHEGTHTNMNMQASIHCQKWFILGSIYSNEKRRASLRIPAWMEATRSCRPQLFVEVAQRDAAHVAKNKPEPLSAWIPDVCHHWSLCSLRHLIRRKYARALIGALKHPKVVFAWRLSPTINLESVFIERLPSRRQVSGSRRIKTSVKL